jgi:hypothetical protein
MRKDQFKEWLIWIGGLLLLINAGCLAFAHNWVFFVFNCVFFLAIIIYELALYFSRD